MIIAVDFDHTIYFETIDKVNFPLIEKLIKVREKGHKLILWTCRGGLWLEEAVDFCECYGLVFDSVNENIKGIDYTNISCKAIADLYVDDKAPGSIEYFMNKKFKGVIL